MPANASAAVSSWQKGISIQSAYAADFGSEAFRQSVNNAALDGVNTVTLVIPLYQSNIYSTDVQTGSNTPTDAALVSGVQYLRSKGMAVSFAIHINPYDGQWRAFINPSDRQTWFNNYGSLVRKFATIGQSQGVSQIIIGTELSSMTNPSYNSTNTNNWTQLISSIRAVYGGSLTYSAQRSGFMSDAQQLGFWPLLDKIGISAYYGMGDNDNASVQDLMNRWDHWNQTEVAVLASQYNKPILFTEVGYVSRSGGLSDPGSAYALSTGYNSTPQTTAYQALFTYWDRYSYMQGVNLWDWKSNPTAGGAGDTDYTPQNKPAEQVVKDWFTRTGSTAPAPAPTTPSSYTLSAVNTGTGKVGATNSTDVSFASSQPVQNVIVDIEIFNSAGEKIKQTFFENQSLSSTAKNFNTTWTAPTAGQYTIKAGVFTAGWASNLHWNGQVKTVSITTSDSPAPAPQPAPAPAPAPAPQPSPTPEPAPAPAPQPAPAPAPVGRNLSIWWPSNGSAVTGFQPFKAVVDGLDVNQYQMFWQVDGGVLNNMATVNDAAPHKESQVDVTGWKWNASKQYIITFIAKDASGKEIARKSTTITVN